MTWVNNKLMEWGLITFVGAALFFYIFLESTFSEWGQKAVIECEFTGKSDQLAIPLGNSDAAIEAAHFRLGAANRSEGKYAVDGEGEIQVEGERFIADFAGTIYARERPFFDRLAMWITAPVSGSLSTEQLSKRLDGMNLRVRFFREELISGNLKDLPGKEKTYVLTRTADFENTFAGPGYHPMTYECSVSRPQ